MYTYILTILVVTHFNREWSSELKYSMQTLRKHLEEECDAYFLKIEKHAVKVPNNGPPYPAAMPLTYFLMIIGLG